VTDLQFASVSSHTPSAVHSPPCPLGGSTKEASIHASCAISVAAEHAIPLPKALEKLRICISTETTAERRQSFMRQFRSLLFMGGVQAMTLARASNFAAARQVTVAVANTHKINFPDNHRHLFATVAQVFVSGHVNIDRMFMNTAWEGVYGALYETGVIGDVGIGAQTLNSDARRIPCFTTQQHVDELSSKIAGACCVQVSDTEYSEIPLQLHGPMRACVAGVHACLNPLVGAFETLRCEFDLDHMLELSSNQDCFTQTRRFARVLRSTTSFQLPCDDTPTAALFPTRRREAPVRRSISKRRAAKP
ncbi:hypothetical protein N9S81_00535, partial [bacterium]|nr:hypothetical protein [bacterium]